MLWYVTTHNPVEVFLCFIGTYWFHLQGLRGSEVSNQQNLSACFLLLAGYLPDLLFYPEDGGSTFL
jgi:hypothetical protein